MNHTPRASAQLEDEAGNSITTTEDALGAHTIFARAGLAEAFLLSEEGLAVASQVRLAAGMPT
jgi:hypothetical protein